MWGWVGVGAEYSKGLECCGATSSCSSSRNNCPGIWIFFFCLGVSCQLLAGHWGRGQSMFL